MKSKSFKSQIWDTQPMRLCDKNCGTQFAANRLVTVAVTPTVTGTDNLLAAIAALSNVWLVHADNSKYSKLEWDFNECVLYMCHVTHVIHTVNWLGQVLSYTVCARVRVCLYHNRFSLLWKFFQDSFTHAHFHLWHGLCFTCCMCTSDHGTSVCIHVRHVVWIACCNVAFAYYSARAFEVFDW
jgi:hypothetical protein